MANMLNESIDVNAKDLLAMLAGEEEEEAEEDEERDIVTALFAGPVLAVDSAELKRKRESEDTPADNTATAAPSRTAAPAATAAAAAAPGPASSSRLMKTVTRIRKVGPDAGPLSLKVDSSTRVTTTNPNAKTSRLARESFVSDRVLDESVGQEGVFREVEPAVAGLFQGSNSVVLTYGSTGSGKSYTIMGTRSGDAAAVPGEEGRREGVLGSGDGILPRALQLIYQQGRREASGEVGLDGGGGDGESSGGVVAAVSVQALEVYNDKPYDLLREGRAGATSQPAPHLSIKQGGDGQDVIEGLSVEFPPDLPSALGLARSARARAHVNRTSLNDRSSRGHVIFMLGVHGTRAAAVSDPDPRRPGDPVMYVCDLAGPERQNRAALGRDGGDGSSEAELRDRSREAVSINLDTTEMFRAWKLVRDKAPSVSCRTRTLMRVLKPLFVRRPGTPTTNCVMVVCVNPAQSEYGETSKVLKNSQISSKVLEALEEGPSIRKRQRVSGRAGAGGGSAAAAAAAGTAVIQGAAPSAGAKAHGKGKGKLGRAGVGVAVQAPGPEGDGDGEEDPVQLRAQIERLEEKNDRMKAEHDTERYEAEERFEEYEKDIAHVEGLLEKEQQKVRELKEQLDNKSPVGVRARAEAAQSTMKIRAKQAESVRKMDRETTREADDEAARQAEERARAEEQLAAALAERDQLRSSAELEKRRANAADAKADRALRDRSEERSARRRAEDRVERLEAAAKAEAGRREDFEGKLRAAQEEIAPRESDDERAAALPAAAAADAAVFGDSGGVRASPPITGGRRSSEGGVEVSRGRRDGHSAQGSPFEHGDSDQGEEEERETSSVSMVDDFGSSSSSSGGGGGRGRDSNCSWSVGDSGALADAQRQETEKAENGTVGAPSPSISVGGTPADIVDNDGRSEEVDDVDKAEPTTVENHEPSPSPSPKVAPKTRGRRRLGQVEASQQIAVSPGGGAPHQRTRKPRVGRKPLGKIQNGATPARPTGAKSGKKEKVCVDENQEDGAATVVVEVEDEEDEEAQGENKTSKTSRAGRGKGTRAEKERAKKAEEGKETRRCRQMRKNVRLSKPSPDVVVMTELQAKNVDAARRIVRERRLRGGRR